MHAAAGLPLAAPWAAFLPRPGRARRGGPNGLCLQGSPPAPRMHARAARGGGSVPPVRRCEFPVGRKDARAAFRPHPSPHQPASPHSSLPQSAAAPSPSGSRRRMPQGRDRVRTGRPRGIGRVRASRCPGGLPPNASNLPAVAVPSPRAVRAKTPLSSGRCTCGTCQKIRSVRAGAGAGYWDLETMACRGQACPPPRCRATGRCTGYPCPAVRRTPKAAPTRCISAVVCPCRSECPAAGAAAWAPPTHPRRCPAALRPRGHARAARERCQGA